MNLSEIIQSRRSIFPEIFNGQEVSDTDIELVLEAANWAPSHKKTNPWRFKVVKGAALQRLGAFLANCYKERTEAAKFSQFKFDKIQKKTTKSSAVIVICMQRDLKERVPEWEEIAATAMAVQNLWLKATDLGIGGYWSSPSFITEMHRFFTFAKAEKCLGFFYLGYYDAENGPLSISKKVAPAHWITE